MCTLERVGDVYLLRFTGSTSEHRFNPSFADAIVSALATVNASDAGALVTTNEGKFFSNGLDLAWRDEDPVSRRAPLSAAFNRLLEAFLRVNVPTIAAIRGHASAGGFILALAHDHRHMLGQRGFLYMSELDVAIVIPEKVNALIRSKMSARAFKEVVLKAPKLTAAQAHALELVDGVHSSPEATLETALAEGAALAQRKWNKEIYLNMRLTMYPEVVAGFTAAASKL